MENIDYRIDRVLATGYPEPVTGGRLTCAICGENIYGGEDYYKFADDVVCDECEVEYILNYCQRVAPYDL